MRIVPPPNLLSMTEKDFEAEVVRAGEWNNWVIIHVREMRGNAVGIPDLICFHQRGQFQLGEMIELKKTGGYLSAGQKRWHANAEAKGILVWTLWPSDWELLLDIFEGKADVERARRLSA